MTTSRTDFVETWLNEMPSGLGSFETYDGLVYTIKDLLKNNAEKIQVDTNLYKIELPTSVCYWYESNNKILLGVILDKKSQGLVVGLTGKLPSLRSKAPYASDLYHLILKDSGKNIRILSDTQLSDQGYAVWKQLFAKGHKVSVYDRNQPGKTFKTFNDPNEMDQYFAQDDTDYERYQFVLSEQTNIAECRSFFNIRRYRELTGLSLED
jgi:hypothetical protein